MQIAACSEHGAIARVEIATNFPTIFSTTYVEMLNRHQAMNPIYTCFEKGPMVKGRQGTRNMQRPKKTPTTKAKHAPPKFLEISEYKKLWITDHSTSQDLADQ